MKRNAGPRFNGKDVRISLLLSLVPVCASLAIILKLNTCSVEKAFGGVADTLSTFSLTFLGFMLTAFTILQILESKDWFGKIKSTLSFGKLLNGFKLLIALSAFGIFFALFMEMSSDLISFSASWIKATIIFPIWLIAFITAFAWKTISAIIELFRA